MLTRSNENFISSTRFIFWVTGLEITKGEIFPMVVSTWSFVEAVRAAWRFVNGGLLTSCVLRICSISSFLPCHGTFLWCELRIVSDANRFFIETIFNHLGLRHCFIEINTNPGYVDEQGRLRILPFHDFNKLRMGIGMNEEEEMVMVRERKEPGELVKVGKKFGYAYSFFGTRTFLWVCAYPLLDTVKSVGISVPRHLTVTEH